MPIFTVGAAGTVTTSSHEVANSLRFETGSAKSLSVNASTSASTRTFTYSFWTKRALNPSDQEDYLGAGGSADQNHIQLRNDHVRVRHYASGHSFDVETDGGEAEIAANAPIAVRQAKQAIHKGVPMFNSGHHAQTAALYMKAGKDVLGQCSSSACPASAKTIKTALHKASAEHCPTSQAWIMRKAFDHVLASSN